MYAQFTNNRELLEAAADSIRWYPPSPHSRVRPTGLLVMAEETRALRGGISAMRAAIQGLKLMPGRKSIVFFFGRDDSATEIQFRGAGSVGSQATRAAVTIYTIDARGLPTLMSNAESRSWHPPDVSAFFESQGGMALLADRTGGTFFRNDNGLREGSSRRWTTNPHTTFLGTTPDLDRSTGDSTRFK